jgi:large subunit ribosomal protein L10
MNTQEKEQVVQELSTRFSKAPAAFVVHYQGCTCEELTGLRNDLRPSGAKFAVVKNTLAKLAVQRTSAAKLADVFDGPTAVVWSGKDAVAPAKLLSHFSKTKESFAVKAGVFEGNVLDAAGVQSLATMPSKEELTAKLLGLLNAPAIQLLRMLNAPAASLVRALEAWRAELEKKEK